MTYGRSVLQAFSEQLKRSTQEQSLTAHAARTANGQGHPSNHHCQHQQVPSETQSVFTDG